MMMRIAAVLMCWMAGVAGPLTAAAGERVVVVELFTSQGCSSCPPADALLGELAEMEGVLPLAFHVDYWDYIGWKDPYGKPEYTKRQKGYAYASGHRTIYTPQMIVGGVDHIVGYKPMYLADHIQAHKAQPEPVSIALTREGAAVMIKIPAAAGVGPAQVQVLRYIPSAVSDIRRGENAGKRLTYHNIVTALELVAEWDGASDFAQSVDAAGDEPVVVVLQRPDHGAIIASARLR